MKKTIYLKALIVTIILSSTLFASNNAIDTKKKPKVVDEGLDLKPKEDKTKEITFVNDKISKERVTLSLEKEGEEVVINFIKSSKVPLTCKVMRNKTEVLSISKEPKNPKVSTQVIFKIDKSELQVDDKIIVINRRNIKIRNIEIIK